jgi:predicted GNAT superfamily acetyltransferase
MESFFIRHPESADYPRIVAATDEWWSGSSVVALMHRFFFLHFRDTCFVAEREGELAGFLIGFLSQSHPQEAYIHFVGVNPDLQQEGLGRQLYDRFFAVVRQAGRTVVRCVTSPGNRDSLAFHARMGFTIEPQEAEEDGVAVSLNYDGRGGSRVLFVKELSA